MISPHESKYNPCLKSPESNSKLLLKGQNDGTWNLYVMLALYFYDKVCYGMVQWYILTGLVIASLSQGRRSHYIVMSSGQSVGVWLVVQLEIMSPVEYIICNNNINHENSICFYLAYDRPVCLLIYELNGSMNRIQRNNVTLRYLIGRNLFKLRDI